MSKELRQVKIDGLDYEIMPRPRCFVLSEDSEHCTRLVECTGVYFNTNAQKFYTIESAYNQNTTADHAEITNLLSNGLNRLYFFTNTTYEGYTDFSFKAYDPVYAIPVKEIYGVNNYTCSFDKLDYFTR